MIKILKRKNGITLIALVVTIVSVLLLTGVSVNIITEDNGAISKSKEAKTRMEFGTFREEMELFIASLSLEDRDFDRNTLSVTSDQTRYSKLKKNDGDSDEIVQRNDLTIYEAIPSVKGNEKYHNNGDCILYILNGTLYVNSSDQEIMRIALEFGCKSAFYNVQINSSGKRELISSEKNLFIKDAKGEVIIPPIVETIGAGAFYKTGVKRLVIPYTCEVISEYAFSFNTDLEEIIIEEKEVNGVMKGVKTIGAWAFRGCTSLTSIDIPSVTSSIGQGAFYNCNKLTSIELPASLKTLNAEVVGACTSLQTITLNEGLVTMGTYPFTGCKNITTIKLPSTLKTINGWTFYNMAGLTTIDVSNNSYFIMEDGMLLTANRATVYWIPTSWTAVVIPDGVKTLYSSSMLQSKATKLTIPASLTTISSGFSTVLKEIEVKTGNTSFKSDNGNLYTANGKTLIKYLENEATFKVAEGCTNFQRYCLQGATNVTKIVFPDSFTTLNGWGFQGATKLKSIYLPKNVNAFNTVSISGCSITTRD